MNAFIKNHVLFPTGYLDQLIKTKTNVLVYYYHDTQKDWCAAVKCDAATQTAEMNNLKSLLDKHPGVKGIVLRKLLDTDTEVSVNYNCLDYGNKRLHIN